MRYLRYNENNEINETTKLTEVTYMKRIKIAQVITRMDWGGSPDVLRVLCRRLDPAVYDLRVIIGFTEHPSDKTKLFFLEFKDKIGDECKNSIILDLISIVAEIKRLIKE